MRNNFIPISVGSSSLQYNEYVLCIRAKAFEQRFNAHHILWATNCAMPIKHHFAQSAQSEHSALAKRTISHVSCMVLANFTDCIIVNKSLSLSLCPRYIHTSWPCGVLRQRVYKFCLSALCDSVLCRQQYSTHKSKHCKLVINIIHTCIWIENEMC